MIWPLSVQWLAKSNQLYFGSFRKKGNNVLSNFKVRFLNWGLCKIPSWNGYWQESTDLQISSHIFFPIISFYEVPTLVVKISQILGQNRSNCCILWQLDTPKGGSENLVGTISNVVGIIFPQQTNKQSSPVSSLIPGYF